MLEPAQTLPPFCNKFLDDACFMQMIADIKLGKKYHAC